MYLDPSSVLDLEIKDFEHTFGDYYTDDDEYLYVTYEDPIDYSMVVFQHGFGYSMSLQYVESIMNYHCFRDLIDFGHVYI
jgi:elongation factor P hydroxylase